MSNNSTWPVVVVSAVIGILFGIIGHAAVAPQVVIPTASEIAALVNVSAPAVTTTTVTAYNDSALSNKVDKLSDKVLRDDLKEAKAEELISDELNSRDFKKAVRIAINNALNASNSTSRVEELKDIVSITVSDSEYTVSGNDASVELDIVVKYLLDGDTDSDDVEKAKFSIELSVSDLDEDDAYEDAEVDDYSASDFDLIKFYD